MIVLQTMLVGFFFSYIGSIPPGTINLSVVQLSLKKQIRDAFHFSMAAALVEFFYASFAVAFHMFFLSEMDLNFQFKLVAAAAMLILGFLNLFQKERKKDPEVKKFKYQGFRSGLIVGVFNPLAIPFWIAVTAYLESQQWIALTSQSFVFYIIGISTGTFALLTTLIFTIRRFNFNLENHPIVNKIMGIVFILLGIYTLWTIY